MTSPSLLYIRAHEEHSGAHTVSTTKAESASYSYNSSVVLSVNATREYGPSLITTSGFPPNLSSPATMVMKDRMKRI